MKKALLSTLAILFVFTITAQFRSDYRNEVIPDHPPTVITKMEAVCCCEWNFQIGSPSSSGRLLFVEDSMEIYINESTMLAQDVSGMLAKLGNCIGSRITITKESDPTVFITLEITGGYDAGALWEYSVSMIDNAGPLTKFTNVCVNFDWSCASGGSDFWPLAGTNPGQPCTGDIFTTGSCIGSIVDTTDSGVCIYATGVTQYSNNGSSEQSSLGIYPAGLAGTAYTPLAVANFNMAGGNVGLSTYTPTFENSFLSMTPYEVTTQSQNSNGLSYIRVEGDSILIGSSYANFSGMKYLVDPEPNFEPLSVPTVQYVDSSIAALQMPNISPATAGDIVAKFNTLLTYLIAAGLMAP